MAWYKTTKGWISTTLGIAMFIVTQWGNAESVRSLYSQIREHFHFVLTWSPVAFFLLAIYFFESERRRSKGYDLSTLGGFALKLRDDLKQFVERYPKPEDTIVGRGNDEMIRKIERRSGPQALREAALENYFYLLFESRTQRIWREFGRFGVHDLELDDALRDRKYYLGFTYNIIADALERLSRLPEAREKTTNEKP